MDEARKVLVRQTFFGLDLTTHVERDLVVRRGAIMIGNACRQSN